MAKVTKVSVSYQRTHSLPAYGNVRPSVMMEAEVGEGEDYVAVREGLALEAREVVEALVDDARERDGLPALYSDAPRYAAWLVDEVDMLFVVPEGAQVGDLPGGWSPLRMFNRASGELWKHTGHRYGAMMRWVLEYAADHPEIAVEDWSDMAPEDVPDGFWAHLTMLGIWARGETRHYENVKSSGGWRRHYYIGPADAFRGIQKMQVTLFASPSAERIDASDGNIPDSQVTEVYNQKELLHMLGERGGRDLAGVPF